MPHKRYAEHLKKWAVRLVVDKDIYGVIQRDSLFSEGPKDIDRPWVAKFLINDVCELQAWPPRNLVRFLGLDRFTTTTYRQCETGDEFHDLPAREVI